MIPAPAALKRYLREVTSSKRASTQIGEHKKSQPLIKHLGKYSLASLSADIVAQYLDARLAGDEDETGKRVPRTWSPIHRCDQEWGIGLPFNPVSNIRRPTPGAGRNRRPTGWAHLSAMSKKTSGFAGH